MLFCILLVALISCTLVILRYMIGTWKQDRRCKVVKSWWVNVTRLVEWSHKWWSWRILHDIELMFLSTQCFCVLLCKVTPYWLWLIFLGVVFWILPFVQYLLGSAVLVAYKFKWVNSENFVLYFLYLFYWEVSSGMSLFMALSQFEMFFLVGFNSSQHIRLFIA